MHFEFLLKTVPDKLVPRVEHQNEASTLKYGEKKKKMVINKSFSVSHNLKYHDELGMI